MRSKGLVIRSIKIGNHNNHHHHNNNHGAAEYVSCARYGGLDLPLKQEEVINTN